MLQNVINRLRIDHLEDLDADVSTIQEQTSGQGQVGGSCEHDHGPFVDVTQCHWGSSS